MAYKGFNTLIQEMKEQQINLINEFAGQGIPMAVIKMNLELAQLSTEEILEKQMLEEKEQYEKQMSEEIEEQLTNPIDTASE